MEYTDHRIKLECDEYPGPIIHRGRQYWWPSCTCGWQGSTPHRSGQAASAEGQRHIKVCRSQEKKQEDR